MRTGLSEEMKQHANKKAYVVIKDMDKDLDRENFEYEFAQAYHYSDFPILDMDDLYKHYTK